MGIILIPSLCHFLAFENKGLVTEMINLLTIPCPKSYFVSTIESLERAVSDLGYPFVAKKREGFASSGVQLISNIDELNSLITREFTLKGNGTEGVGEVIVQEFIEDLKGDWKVIVIGNVAATLWRRVRPDDFRASGSGLFEFIKAPDYVLEFAFCVRKMLSAPYVSLDIAETDDGCKVLEYQVVHFGTTTIDKAKEYYQRHENGWWEVINGGFDLEQTMVEAVLSEIKQS
jgi:glutathione synthase/RimK-type ligase-like ATP-grasp enzyme